MSVYREYEDENGRSPFRSWFAPLRAGDKAIIDMRLRRVEEGNLGDWKAVGGGVKALRFHEGHGWRVYFAQDGKEVVILLLGAAKKTTKRQAQDINQAMAYWTDYKERKKRETTGKTGTKKGPRRRR